MKKVKYYAAGTFLLIMICAVFTGCIIEVNEDNPTLLIEFNDPAYFTAQGLDDYGYGLSVGFSV